VVEEQTPGETSRRRPSLRALVLLAVAAVVVAAGLSVIIAYGDSSTSGSGPHRLSATTGRSTTTATAGASTITSATAPTSTTVPLPRAAPGFVAGHITAVGDSVMLDYQNPLETDIPGISVDAAVSRQWGDGEAILQQLKAAGQLGAEVIVGLSTNGPITSADFDAMMSTLSGASRVVFVNIQVDQPWQAQNNAVLAAGAARYPHVYIADWANLAAQNPQWLGSDGTHLAIDSPGAVALASLVASTLANG
jgi:hypothetical protein